MCNNLLHRMHILHNIFKKKFTRTSRLALDHTWPQLLPPGYNEMPMCSMCNSLLHRMHTGIPHNIFFVFASRSHSVQASAIWAKVSSACNHLLYGLF